MMMVYWRCLVAIMVISVSFSWHISVSILLILNGFFFFTFSLLNWSHFILSGFRYYVLTSKTQNSLCEYSVQKYSCK